MAIRIILLFAMCTGIFSQIIQRLNHGVVFTKLSKAARFKTGNWEHIFALQLPTVNDFRAPRSILPKSLDPSVHSSAETSRNYLLDVLLKEEFQNFKRKFISYESELFKIFPNFNVQDSRSKRALLNLGSAFKFVFGTASQDDLVKLSKLINKIHKENLVLQNTVQIDVKNLTSMVDIQNSRLAQLTIDVKNLSTIFEQQIDSFHDHLKEISLVLFDEISLFTIRYNSILTQANIELFDLKYKFASLFNNRLSAAL